MEGSWRICLARTPAGGEEVAEDACATFMELPTRLGGPEGGQLAFGESGAHTGHAIVTRHMAAAQDAQAAAGSQRPGTATRFAGDKQRAGGRALEEKEAQF